MTAEPEFSEADRLRMARLANHFTGKVVKAVDRLPKSMFVATMTAVAAGIAAIAASQSPDANKTLATVAFHARKIVDD